MAVEQSGDAPWWWAGISVFLGAVGLAIQQFLKGRREEARPSHYVFEAAEVADMNMVRALAPRMEQAIELLERRDHRMSEIDKKLDAVLERIRDIDKEQEIQRRIEEYRRNNEHRSLP